MNWNPFQFTKKITTDGVDTLSFNIKRAARFCNFNNGWRSSFETFTPDSYTIYKMGVN